MLGRMLIGEASLKNLSGPLTIADYAGQSVQQGLAYYLGSWPWSASAWVCSTCCRCRCSMAGT
jgi:membrane-associated protease RseP (regulator of RpoE activity)